MEIAPIKPIVHLDDLQKIDIRVGTIRTVEDISGSNKLVKLMVDFGDRTRCILSGMKEERDDVKEIEGKQALFVLNIPHRKMFGEVSEGMIFDIGWEDGITPVLAVPEKPVPNGARAG